MLIEEKIALPGEVCLKELGKKLSFLRIWVGLGAKSSEEVGNCSLTNMEKCLSF